MRRASFLRRSPLLLLAAALVALAVFFAHDSRPAAATHGEVVWSGTLTVSVSGGDRGCGGAVGVACSTDVLTSGPEFTLGGVAYEIEEIRVNSSGTLILELDRTIPNSVTSLQVGNAGFTLANASRITVDVPNDRVAWASSGLSWSVGDTVQLRLTIVRPSGVTLAGSSLDTSGGGHTLTVNEGSSATFTVALSADPGSNTTVQLIRQEFGVHGGEPGDRCTRLRHKQKLPDTERYGAAGYDWDRDAASVSPASLTFTAGGSGNWGTAQTVTVSAPRDADTVNEQMVVLLLVSQGRQNPGPHNPQGATRDYYGPVGGTHSGNSVTGVYVKVTDTGSPTVTVTYPAGPPRNLQAAVSSVLGGQNTRTWWVDLSWGPPSGSHPAITGYEVQASDLGINDNFECEQWPAATTSDVDGTSLRYGYSAYRQNEQTRTFRFRVRAKTASGGGEWAVVTRRDVGRDGQERRQGSPGQQPQGAQQPEQDSPTHYSDLIAQVRQWRNDPNADHEQSHRERWDRALLALGETVADASLTPMTAAEAEQMARTYMHSRWNPVAQALRAIEAAATQQPDQNPAPAGTIDPDANSGSDPGPGQAPGQGPGQAPANQAPTVDLAIADATLANESATRQVFLTGRFSDADSDPLTITAASSDTAVATVAVAADYSSLTVSAQARGTATITVTASDGNGGTVSDTFTVTVKAAPVVASALADLSLEPEANHEVSLTGVFSDPDGDALTITAASSDPDTVSAFIWAGTLTVLAVTEGSATITLTAEDADGNTVTDTFDVTVSAPPAQTPANRAPTVAAALDDLSLATAATQEVSLAGVFGDADSDPLAITAASSDTSVATVSVAADYASLTVSAQAEGTATITVTADDGAGGTVSDTFEVTVAAPEPDATETPDIVARYDANGNGKIDIPEYLRAMRDRAHGTITQAELDQVVDAWLASAYE